MSEKMREVDYSLRWGTSRILSPEAEEYPRMAALVLLIVNKKMPIKTVDIFIASFLPPNDYRLSDFLG